MTNATSSLLAKRCRSAVLSLFALALAVGCASAFAQTAAPGTKAASSTTVAQISPTRYPVYDDKYEIYGGINFMNGQAGQALPKRYNMGGGEGMGTYWLSKHFGAAADVRFDAGTTPVLSPYYNRVVVFQYIGMGGAQYRGPRNRYAAVDFHALAGATYGVFDHAIKNYPGGSPEAACPGEPSPDNMNVGLYCNHAAFMSALGGSIDFNYSPRVAIRLQPDLILEHFGTELREYVSVSGGLVYRFGKK